MNHYISVVVLTMRPNKFQNIINNFNRQKHVNKELIIILNNNNFFINDIMDKIKEYKNIFVYACGFNCSIGSGRNFAIKKAKYDYIAFFDDDDFYGENYLANTLKAFKNENAQIVGKRSVNVYFEQTKDLGTYDAMHENSSTILLNQGTLAFKKSALENIEFPNDNIQVDFLIKCKNMGLKFFCGDKNDYVNIRDGRNVHTWNITDDELKTMCSDIIKTNGGFEKWIL